MFSSSVILQLLGCVWMGRNVSDSKMVPNEFHLDDSPTKRFSNHTYTFTQNISGLISPNSDYFFLSFPLFRNSFKNDFFFKCNQLKQIGCECSSTTEVSTFLKNIFIFINFSNKTCVSLSLPPENPNMVSQLDDFRK